MKKHKWITLFQKMPFGNIEYVGKFGCEASLLGYLHFHPIETYFVGSVDLPEG